MDGKTWEYIWFSNFFFFFFSFIFVTQNRSRTAKKIYTYVWSSWGSLCRFNKRWSWSVWFSLCRGSQKQYKDVKLVKLVFFYETYRVQHDISQQIERFVEFRYGNCDHYEFPRNISGCDLQLQSCEIHNLRDAKGRQSCESKPRDLSPQIDDHYTDTIDDSWL